MIENGAMIKIDYTARIADVVDEEVQVFDTTIEEDAKKHQLREIYEKYLKAPRYVNRDNSYKLGKLFPTVGGDVTVVEVEIK